MRVHYKQNGWIQIREVPEGSSEEHYEWGIHLGPPDLSDLSLSQKQTKELSNQLALRDFAEYEDTKSRRGELMQIIHLVTGKKEKSLLKELLYIYQNETLEDVRSD